jgi:ElaB/YqjD/DUF883 family membrane-anchored ribosome-binding protein
MADMQSAPTTPGTQRAQASPRQESHETAGQHDPRQETGKELRTQTQELMTQGKEVAAKAYEEGRHQVLAWQQHLENQVREKPLPSVCIAARIGKLNGIFAPVAMRAHPRNPAA